MAKRLETNTTTDLNSWGNRVSPFSFRLAKDSSNTLFLIKADTSLGVSSNVTIATGATFVPSGAITVVDPATSGLSLNVDLFEAIVTNGSNWVIGNILSRVLIVNTATNSVNATIWQSSNNTTLTVIPIIGVDVIDLDRQTLALTSTLQSASNSSLGSIDGKLPLSLGQKTGVGSLPVVLASDAPLTIGTLPLSAALASLQSVGNTSLSSIETKLPPLGQTLAGGCIPVVLTAAQLSLLVPPTTVNANTGLMQPLTDAQLRASSLSIVAASLPLPLGAATASNQNAINNALVAIASNTVGNATVGNQITANITLATIASNTASLNIRTLNPSDTVTIAASVLPFGAATAANQNTSNIALTSIAFNTTYGSTAANQNVANNNLVAINNALTVQATSSNQAAIIFRLNAIESKLRCGYHSKVNLQRDSNTNQYNPDDVYGSAFELQNIGAAGGIINLSTVRVVLNISAVPINMTNFLLYLYSVSPPSVIIDNGMFNISAGDRASLLTPNGIDLGIAQLVVGGGTVVLLTPRINEQLKLAAGSTSLWGYLVTRGGFIPASPNEVAILTAIATGI